MSKLNDNQSINKAAPRSWSDYYKAVANRPPRETLLTALANFEPENEAEPRTAIDLGCGEGRDTVELLRRGWKVIAIDSQQEAIERLKNRCDKKTVIETRIAQFENIDLPSDVDLINASFSLPFCKPENFPELWHKIVSGLTTGGRFSGHLFGDRDSWAADSTMSNHTMSQIEALLQPFEVELLSEEDHPGKTALGHEKHWHIFHIVARKK
ncbi:Tellurite resistance protein TehB [Rivularia sp. PCC 7116]|uniref:class I SAM-dependent methyltransferase n=1 Tax=Rivularia sp. PCC 7116 TaxID=373994 RepID=UPI00029F3E35|nr:class I SAM-dependent methyltransferase [Rivularia sp. PCC 7116]AFY58557.1 Tellurite resistance protein TehB [Rivularia sp. PCC 7116]